MFLHRKHLGPQISQILRNQIHTRNPFFQHINYLVSRSLNPFPLHSRRTGSRNLPECIECPEMIDPNNIKQLRAVTDPIHPELISILLQIIPVIDGIPPSLPGRAEVIRRNSGDKDRPSVRVQQKVLSSCPYIHGIQSHIKRNIPHNLNSVLIRRLLNIHPLLIEEILKELVIFCLFFNIRRKRGEAPRPVAILLLPLQPAFSAVL